MQNNGYIWGAVVAVVIIVGAFFIFHSRAIAPGTGSMATSTNTAATSTAGNGVSMTNSGSGTIQLVNSNTPPPSLTGAIVMSPSLPADAQAALRTQEQTFITELKAAPTRVDLWLQLGVTRKIAGDYAGAEAAWQYVAATGPTSINYVAYGDLGDIYMNFDVNYPKAESNYKAAIAINPTIIDYYKDLAMLYSSFYKTNQGLATSIVAQGLKANPNNSDLLQLQAQLKANQ